MRRSQVPLSLLGVFLILCVNGTAQNSISIQPAGGWSLLRPYRQRAVSPVNLSNSNRLEELIRAGKLYLSSRDVVALAIEDNLDIEIQRYAPFLQREILRDVSTPIAPAPASVSATGVQNVTTISTSVATTSGGGVVSSIGTALPNLDPSLGTTLVWGHATF